MRGGIYTLFIYFEYSLHPVNLVLCSRQFYSYNTRWDDRILDNKGRFEKILVVYLSKVSF